MLNYFNVQTDLDLVSGSIFKLVSVSFWHDSFLPFPLSLFLFSFFLSFSFLFQHFLVFSYKEPWLLLVGNSIRNENLGARLSCLLGSFMNSARKCMFRSFYTYLNLLYIYLCCIWTRAYMWYVCVKIWKGCLTQLQYNHLLIICYCRKLFTCDIMWP